MSQVDLICKWISQHLRLKGLQSVHNSSFWPEHTLAPTPSISALQDVPDLLYFQEGRDSASLLLLNSKNTQQFINIYITKLGISFVTVYLQALELLISYLLRAVNVCALRRAIVVSIGVTTSRLPNTPHTAERRGGVTTIHWLGLMTDSGETCGLEDVVVVVSLWPRTQHPKEISYMKCGFTWNSGDIFLTLTWTTDNQSNLLATWSFKTTLVPIVSIKTQPASKLNIPLLG